MDIQETTGSDPSSPGPDWEALRVPRAAEEQAAEARYSAVRSLIISIAGIGLAEIVAMIVVYFFRDRWPYVVQTLVDAGIMLLLMYPLIYQFSLKPLLHNIEHRRQTEGALRRSEQRFAIAFHSSPAALSVSRLLDGRFIDVNRAWLRLCGYERGEVIGHTALELDLYPSVERSELVRRLQADGRLPEFEIHAKTKAGEFLTVLASSEMLELDGEQCILASLVDVTERKRAEGQLHRLNRDLRTINDCNQALVRAEDEEQLLATMCAILVNTGGYRMAWVGYAEENTERTIRPVCHYGFENGYLSRARLSWDDTEHGRGPTGSAIRTGSTQVNRSFADNPDMLPWRAAALERGYKASISLPLKSGEHTFGALTMYSASVEVFDAEEVHLLNELAGDMAYGINALRERVERRRADERVRELALFPTLNPDVVLRVDAAGRIQEVNAAGSEAGIRVGMVLAEVIPDLGALDLPACIASGSVERSLEARLGEGVLLWRVRGVPRRGVAFLYSTNITQRKEAENAIRRLSRIVEQTEDTVVITDCQGMIEYVNPAFERSTGYSQEEALGNTPRVIKSGLHDEAFYRNLWQTVLRGEVFQGEIANRKKNGEIFHEVKTITPLRDADGQITHFVATGKDITEHKLDEEKLLRAYGDLELRVQERTEQLRIANTELEDEISIRRSAELALRKSEQRLSRGQEIAHLGSWELDLASGQLTWTDEVYRIFGLQPQEFGATYEAFLEAVHPDDRAAVDEAYSGSLREGKDSYEIEHRVVKRGTGEVRIVHEKCEHLRDESGRIIRSLGMVHDVTERKRAEQALQAAHDELELRVEERTRELAVKNQELVKEIVERKEVERQMRTRTTAMEAAANGIVITDREGVIQWTNPAVTRMTGYTAEDLAHKSTRIFKSGQQEAAFYKDMWDTILAGDVWRGELINRRKNGSLYFEEETITPVRAEDGHILHFIAIKQDISERKRAEEELEQRNVKLEAISRAEHAQRQLSDALVEAALILNKSMKLDEVLPLILEQVKEAIPYRLADIMLLDGDWAYDASHKADIELPAGLSGTGSRFALQEWPILEKMRQSGRAALIGDVGAQTDWRLPEELPWIRSFLSAPLLAESRVIGFLNLASDEPNFFTEEMCNRLVAFAAHAAVAIQNAWLFEQVQASTERLQSLSRRLVEVQESERLYISRELHDEAGQMLTSLLVDLRLLEKNAAQPDAILKIVTEMESSLNAVIENLHRIAMALRPASLDHVGLVAALRQHLESVGDRNGLKVRLQAERIEHRLPANVETVLYRIVQEALTNIVRHAHASQVDVVLTVHDNQLVVIIEDDGVGFDPDVVTTGEHLGVFGMRERTEMIGGKLTVESAPGRGTTIMVEVGYADSIADRG